jgi:hypothetical protein
MELFRAGPVDGMHPLLISREIPLASLDERCFDKFAAENVLIVPPS